MKKVWPRNRALSVSVGPVLTERCSEIKFRIAGPAGSRRRCDRFATQGPGASGIPKQVAPSALGGRGWGRGLAAPPNFSRAYDRLRELRIPDERIRTEAFRPSTLLRRPDSQASDVLPAPATEPVQVIFSKSGKEARWHPSSRTPLDLAESRGLTPETLYRNETCGTCRTPVLEGEVTYASRLGAKPGSGRGLICCAIPAAVSARRMVPDL